MFKHKLLTLVCIFMLAATLIVPSRAANAAATVTNPGFEADNDVTTSPEGWTVTGTAGASYTEWGGHSGNWRISNWRPEAYTVETSQTLTGLTDGWYTL